MGQVTVTVSLTICDLRKVVAHAFKVEPVHSGIANNKRKNNCLRAARISFDGRGSNLMPPSPDV